jgi:hypothetical protein
MTPTFHWMYLFTTLSNVAMLPALRLSLLNEDWITFYVLSLTFICSVMSHATEAVIILNPGPPKQVIWNYFLWNILDIAFASILTLRILFVCYQRVYPSLHSSFIATFFVLSIIFATLDHLWKDTFQTPRDYYYYELFTSDPYIIYHSLWHICAQVAIFFILLKPYQWNYLLNHFLRNQTIM